MTIDVLALVGLSSERVASLQAAGYNVRVSRDYATRMDAFRACASARALLTNGRDGLNRADMALLPTLELILAVGAGYEAVDLEAARERNIAVANCPDTNAPAVADSAVMLLMAAARHLPQQMRFVRDGGWQEQWRPEIPQISGKRLGILGLGKIGGRIAYRAARGFDMEIGYHNRSAVRDSSYRYFDNLVELATWADFLISAAPGGAGTRHLINAEVLTALGAKGVVVNVGRGSIVDTAALIEALEAGRIAGAALDVVEGEPNVPAALLRMENVIVTPHVAGRSPESRAASSRMILDTLSAHFAGKPVPSSILARG